LLASPAARAQQAAVDYFNGGAQSYISNNIPKALEIVTNGRALYPADTELKKLEDLLKQQQQQQQQQQNQKNQQQQNQQNQQQKNQSQQSKEQQQQQQQQNQSGKEQKQEQGSEQPQPPQAQMTPAEAERMLDSQKGEESALVFKPAARPEDQNRKFKDW